MSTLTTYRTSVQLKGYDALATATIDAAIQEARRRVLQDGPWSWAATTSLTLPTVANVDSVVLTGIATDLLALNAVRLSDTAGVFPVQWRPYSIIRDLQDRYPATGRPQFWSQYGPDIVFYPTPSGINNVIIEYQQEADDITTTDALIPDRYSDLVVWAACSSLAYRQRQFDAASAADQMYSKVLLPAARARDRATQTQTSTQIRTGYWRS
jgi:hypothetical protein